MVLFQTKSATLRHLSNKLLKAKILPQFPIKQSDWESYRERCLDSFAGLGWSEQSLIVRSCFGSEDSFDGSWAGHFSSYQNVLGREQLLKAIDQVMSKYKSGSSENTVFIQPMLQDVVLSGVAFTCISPSGAPYYLINYDNISGLTDTVTSGKTNSLKTFYCHRLAELEENTIWFTVISFLKEIEQHCQSASPLADQENLHSFCGRALDVEFAITRNRTIYLFQVRPLVIQNQEVFDHDIGALAKTIKIIGEEKRELLGESTIYGIMPDWNPAELIGIRPKPLALSLFKELISDRVWALSRYQYGYRDVREVPLIQSFGGQPYVDVRASFNSFIPRDLDHNIASKLVNYYLDLLRKNPNLHDKVEFEIILSCFSFDLPRKLEILQRGEICFSKSETRQLESSLRTLTNRISHFKTGLWRFSLEQLSSLELKYEKTLSKTNESQLEKIHQLLQDCKNYGTLPFAGLARAAFVATQILRSLLSEDIIDLSTFQQFLQNLRTINSVLTDDLHSIEQNAFLKKYGHLRPGTFDIMSQRYDEAPDLYFNFSAKKRTIQRQEAPFLLTPKQTKAINALLCEHRLEHDAFSLFGFIAEAMKGREYGKFVFSKNVSAILKLIEEFGQERNLTREECSYLEIADLFSLSTEERSIKDLHALVERRKKEYMASTRLHLPPLIFDEKDVYSFELFEESPTFVTTKRIQAVKAEIGDKDLDGKIIFIESADPGYDWIFLRGIAALITCYGGANSHMTIRAAELNLPAIIGCGQALYRKWRQYTLLDLDCANKKVIPLK